jgi:hypothetical protein
VTYHGTTYVSMDIYSDHGYHAGYNLGNLCIKDAKID